MSIEDTHVCVKDAAALLGVSRQRVALLCKRGQLPGARLTFGRWLIPRAAVEARLRQNRPKSRRRKK